MEFYQATSESVAQFQKDGYVIVRGLFRHDEMDLLGKIGRVELVQRAHAVADAQGGQSKLWLASDTASVDVYNAICHSHRVVDTMAALLGDEVYLYHYKMMVKEPRVGGAWEWHQYYGYWYNNGCLFPNMASCYIAVDRAHKGNGCLQLIKGSNRMGRIDHGKTGGQTGADQARVDLALEHMDLVYAELEVGDALFFHSNTLHRSDQNRSEDPRWGLICCYNARHNPCRNAPGHPSYSPLEIWPDERVLEVADQHWARILAVQDGEGLPA